jgi:hypothetical protein
VSDIVEAVLREPFNGIDHPWPFWSNARWRGRGEIMVAKGGIEPPTQGFSGRPDKRGLITNQALATHATFREQRHEGWNESNEATKSYGVATVPIF